MEVIPERGEVWRVALDPTLGSEIRKTPPWIVVSVRVLNERRRKVIVEPLSSSPKASPPILIPITCDGRPAVAVIDQIRAVAKERLRNRPGVMAEERTGGAGGRSQADLATRLGFAFVAIVALTSPMEASGLPCRRYPVKTGRP